MDFGYKIKKLRELRNYTQEHLSLELGISQRAYSDIENNKTTLSLERSIIICKVLNVDLNELIEFEPQNVLAPKKES